MTKQKKGLTLSKPAKENIYIVEHGLKNVDTNCIDLMWHSIHKTKEGAFKTANKLVEWFKTFSNSTNTPVMRECREELGESNLIFEWIADKLSPETRDLMIVYIYQTEVQP